MEQPVGSQRTDLKIENLLEYIIKPIMTSTAPLNLVELYSSVFHKDVLEAISACLEAGVYTAVGATTKEWQINPWDPKLGWESIENRLLPTPAKVANFTKLTAKPAKKGEAKSEVKVMIDKAPRLKKIVTINAMAKLSMAWIFASMVNDTVMALPELKTRGITEAKVMREIIVDKCSSISGHEIFVAPLLFRAIAGYPDNANSDAVPRVGAVDNGGLKGRLTSALSGHIRGDPAIQTLIINSIVKFVELFTYRIVGRLFSDCKPQDAEEKTEKKEKGDKTKTKAPKKVRKLLESGMVGKSITVNSKLISEFLLDVGMSLPFLDCNSHAIFMAMDKFELKQERMITETKAAKAAEKAKAKPATVATEAKPAAPEAKSVTDTPTPVVEKKEEPKKDEPVVGVAVVDAPKAGSRRRPAPANL